MSATVTDFQVYPSIGWLKGLTNHLNFEMNYFLLNATLSQISLLLSAYESYAKVRPILT